MKTDAQLKNDVEAELEWDPSINAAEVGAAVKSVLQWNSSVPFDQIHVKVEKGWVTLSGEVDWEYQRAAAVNLVRPLIGVVGVNNSIVIRPRATPDNIEKRIREALTRQAERKAKGIEVQVVGSTVVLKGSVYSLAEQLAAQGAAWSAPGITQVKNELRVYP